MSTVKVHRVKNQKNLIQYYRIIPYSELVEILRDDGEAFLEGPFKRQTVWKAGRRLSEMLGKKVTAKRALLRLENGDSLEGYSFSVD
jgi:hypothetical protein